MRRDTVITCPACGHAEPATMPDDACIVVHACAGCGAVLKPRSGDCCIFCSYGSVPCPPVQLERAGCCEDGRI